MKKILANDTIAADARIPTSTESVCPVSASSSLCALSPRTKGRCADIVLPVPSLCALSPSTKGRCAEGAQPLQAVILPPLLGEGAGGEG